MLDWAKCLGIGGLGRKIFTPLDLYLAAIYMSKS
jgi:hypothetical protein